MLPSRILDLDNLAGFGLAVADLDLEALSKAALVLVVQVVVDLAPVAPGKAGLVPAVLALVHLVPAALVMADLALANLDMADLVLVVGPSHVLVVGSTALVAPVLGSVVAKTTRLPEQTEQLLPQVDQSLAVADLEGTGDTGPVVHSDPGIDHAE